MNVWKKPSPFKPTESPHNPELPIHTQLRDLLAGFRNVLTEFESKVGETGESRDPAAFEDLIVLADVHRSLLHASMRVNKLMDVPHQIEAASKLVGELKKDDFVMKDGKPVQITDVSYGSGNLHIVLESGQILIFPNPREQIDIPKIKSD